MFEAMAKLIEDRDRKATVLPKVDFDPDVTARELKTAMNGLGTGEETIINNLAVLTNQERLEVAEKFECLFGEDIVDSLKSELSGDFEECVEAMMTPKFFYDARSLKAAMKGDNTDEATLVEILCSRTRNEIIEIKAAYSSEFEREVEEDLQTCTTGHFEKLFLSQCHFNRPEGEDLEQAREDAKVIYDSPSGQWFYEEAKLHAIFCSRSYSQLREMFCRYRELSGRDIEDTIKAETSGVVQAGILAFVRYAKRPADFFAQRLYGVMKGAGTDEDTLTRIILTRAEVDLKCINSIFHKEYGTALHDYMDGNVSGNYKRMLMKMCGFEEEDDE